MTCVNKNSEDDEETNNKVWTVDGNPHNVAIEKKCYTYDEAITLAGNGCYNKQLLVILSLTLIAMLLDMFGYSVVVAGLSCDFQLSITEKGILTSMPFAGAIIMAYPWGYISDTKGRRKTLIIAMSVSFIVAVISSFSPSWQTMAVLKLIGTSFSSSAHSTTYVLLGECCAPRLRGVYLLLMTSAIMLTPTIYNSVGYFTLELDFSYHLGFLDIHFRPWRLLALMLAIPLGISAFSFHYFYESPKFLANLGKTEEAITILAKIFRRNGGDEDKYPVKYFILEEQNIKNTEKSLLKSIWKQTVPLFTPPLLKRTLQLFYIITVLYTTNNAFIVWFPFLSNAIFSPTLSSEVTGNGFCELISSLDKNNKIPLNSTLDLDFVECSNRLQPETVITGIIHSLSFTLLNVIISYFASRKRTVLTLSLVCAIAGGIGTTFATDPVSAMIFFIVFMITAMGMGITSSYFVDLYPTSVRGMAACLGVMVARISSLVGINILGFTIIDHCYGTFYSWAGFIFTGVIVALFLPPDRPSKKTDH